MWQVLNTTVFVFPEETTNIGVNGFPFSDLFTNEFFEGLPHFGAAGQIRQH
jgi:hypothetical protein